VSSAKTAAPPPSPPSPSFRPHRYSLSPAVFKSNASGAAKNTALAVLEKYTDEIYVGEIGKGSVIRVRNIGDKCSEKFTRSTKGGRSNR
jgi:hypothetical protein